MIVYFHDQRLMFVVVIIFDIHLRKDNSVKDFNFDDQATLFSSKSLFRERLLCSISITFDNKNCKMRFDNMIERSHKEIRYFDSKDCERLQQIKSLNKCEIICDLIRDRIFDVEEIVEISLKRRKNF